MRSSSRPQSVSQPAELTCATCKLSFRAEPWIIIDGEADPPLISPATLTTLRRFACPNGHQARINLPLLVYRPALQPELVFFCGYGATRGDAANQLNAPISALAARHKEHFPDVQASYEEACIIPLENIDDFAKLDGGATLPGSTLRF